MSDRMGESAEEFEIVGELTYAELFGVDVEYDARTGEFHRPWHPGDAEAWGAPGKQDVHGFANFDDVGSPAWYAVQFGPQKSYREMLSWHPSDAYDWNLPGYDPTGDPYFEVSDSE